MNAYICPIWQMLAETASPQTRDGVKGQFVDSFRAGGRYFISDTASVILRDWEEPDKVKLTSWLVEQRRLGTICPEISDTILGNVMKRRLLPVHDRADNLLRYLAARSDVLGQVVEFNGLDYDSAITNNQLLAWTASREMSEVTTLAEYCDQEGWIEYRIPKSTGDIIPNEMMLHPPGYARLAELDGINLESRQAFIAMWFDESMEKAYEKGIAPAIRESGYEPLRIDQKEHLNKIDDEIIAEIRRSRFLVADFTQGTSGARGGVYYEAGFAHGLNIPVIFTCRKDVINSVHFDTSHYNHILWETPEDLKTRLEQRISTTIGDGPLKKP